MDIGPEATDDPRYSASIVHLDEYLQAYGPETRALRKHIRQVALSFEERWPGKDFGPTGPTPDAGRRRYVDVQRQILALQPGDPAQRWFQSQALQVAEHLSELRWLVLSQGTATAPLVPVFILIFFSTIAIFGSFALFDRRPDARSIAWSRWPAINSGRSDGPKRRPLPLRCRHRPPGRPRTGSRDSCRDDA
jgi:hypothetical protein